MMMKRGRPKGRSMDHRSFGPLGDLIRSARLAKGYGLLDVAKSCKCSVQFISNIEHGRAPLPWDKAELLAKTLELNPAELKAANLAIRSDFKSFFSAGKPVKKGKSAMDDVKKAASILDMTSQDSALREILQTYSSAPAAARKKFYAVAKKALTD